MTNKTYIPILFCSALVAVVVSVWIARSAPDPGNRVKPELLHTEKGWGYDILVDGKVVVHQPVMPAHGGGLGFGNRTQALHAAQLVISRMGDNQFPGLSQQEVDSIISTYHE